MASKKDYYEILGVEKNVTQDDIKKAFRKLAVKYHPDKNQGNKEFEEKFKEATEAYEVIGDPDKRKRYDQFGHSGVDANTGFGGGGFSNASDFGDVFGDIFGDIFGGAGRGSRRNAGIRGSDLEINVEVDFGDAVFGAEKEVSFNYQKPCDSCSGTGVEGSSGPSVCNDCKGRGEIYVKQGFFSISRTCPKCHGTGSINTNPCTKCKGSGTNRSTKKIMVKIPEGIESGQTLRLRGEGNAGVNGGSTGDLFVTVKIKQHPLFKRDGADVLCEVPISFLQAVNGDEIEIPTVEGKVKMKIPSGTQSGKIFRLNGKGAYRMGSYSRGDQLIKIIVEIPSKISKEQKTLLSQFEELNSPSSLPLKQDFLSKTQKLYK